MLKEQSKSTGREEPFSRLVWLMQRTGQLADTGRFNRPLAIGAFVLMVNGIIAPILYSILVDVPADEKAEAALYATGAITIGFKYFNNYLRQPLVARILALIQQLRDKYYEEERYEVSQEMWRGDTRAFRLVFIILNTLTPLMVMKAIATHKYPYPCWTFLDLRTWYVTNFIWQTMTISMIMFSAGLSYSFNFLTVNQCVLHIKILSSMLKMRDLNVKDIAKRHVLIVKLVRGVNELFCWQIYLEYCFYTVQIAFAGYNFMKLLHMGVGFGPVSVALYVVFLYSSFAYFLCLCGHKITEESELIFRHIYESAWYELPIAEQDTLRE
nr:olfactory receptor 26 [Tropidothorax elegans]